MPKELKNAEAFNKDDLHNEKKFSKQGRRQKDKNKSMSKPWSKEVVVAKANDPAWYTKYAALAENAGRVAFNHRNGEELEIDARRKDTNSSIGVHNQDPIIAVETILTPGESKDVTSAINVMSSAMYKVLNRKYRGSQTSHYQQADVGIIEFGLIDLFASIADAERIYALLLKYKLNQKSLPQAMLAAMGIDYTSFDGRLADFRLALNELIMTAKTICLVKGHTLLDHALYLYSNLFKDKDTERANYYVFIKSGFWKYDPTIMNTGSALVFKPNTASVMGVISPVSGSPSPASYNFRTMDDILADITEQLESFRDDDDVDKISSDILAWFGNDDNSPEIVKLGWIPEELDVPVLCDANTQKQLHNCITYVAFSPTMYQDPTTQGLLGTDYPADIYAAATIPSVPELLVYQKNNKIYFNVNVCDIGTYVAETGSDGIHRVYNGSAAPQGSRFTVNTPVVDTDTLDPSVQEVFEITRFSVAGRTVAKSISGTTRTRLELTSYGSVLPLDYRIYIPLEPGFGGNRTQLTISGSTIEVMMFAYNEAYIEVGHNFNPNMDVMRVFSKFDWAPILYYFTDVDNGYETPFLIGDLDNYKPFPHDVHKKVNKVALMSELHNPIADILIKE